MSDPTARSLADVLADLEGGDPERRRLAADFLARCERDVLVEAVAPLSEALEDEPNPTTRNAVAWALVKASPLGRQFLPHLFLLLRSERPDVRAWTCTLLGNSGAGDARVRPMLEVAAATDPDPEVQWRAKVALREIGSPREG